MTMMIQRATFAAVALGLTGLTAMPALAKDKTLVLSPSSKWIVNYGDSSCRMMRSFGKGEDEVYALFNRYGPGDSFQLTVAGKPLNRITSGPMTDFDTQIQFGPNEGAQDVSGQKGTFSEKPALIFGSHISVENRPEEPKYKFGEMEDRPPTTPISPQRLAAIKWVAIGKENGKRVQLETGAMEKPFAALSACVDNLVTSWGIDPVKDKNLVKRPQPLSDPGQWIRSGDYPSGMVFARQPALVQVRLNVDAGGKVTACHIQETTKPKEFDQAVCGSLTKRASFSPAIDAEGKPAASYWQRTIKFIMPG